VRLRRLLASSAALGAGLLAAAGFGAAPAHAAAAAAAPGPAPSGHVVVIGVEGLEWSDVTESGMPSLYTMVNTGDIATLVTRGAANSTCPADGWLTLGTGSRATAGVVQDYPAGIDPNYALISHVHTYCTPLPTPPAGPGGYQIPDFSTYTSANAAYSYNPIFGSLEAPVAAAGGCVAASGPGALLAAADADGRVSDYLGDPTALSTADLGRCAVTLVDLGGLSNLRPTAVQPRPTPLAVRTYPYTILDAQLAALMAKLPNGTTVVIAGLSDSSFSAELHAVLVTTKGSATAGSNTAGSNTAGSNTPGSNTAGSSTAGSTSSRFTGGRWLFTASTRHDGLLQTIDLTPSILRWSGLTQAQIEAADTKPFTGSLIGTGGPAPADPGQAIVSQTRLAVANDTYGSTNAKFITWMAHAVTILVWAAGIVFVLVRWLPERYSPSRYAQRYPILGRWRRILTRAIGVWATTLAAIAPASFLANLVPWSSTGSPGAVLFLSIAAITLLLTAVTLAVCLLPGLRGQPLAPAGLLGLATLAIIAADVATGSHLQAQTPFGLSYIIAGRFYGIGNSAIGVYCAAAMVGSTWIASLLMPRRGPGEIPPHVWPRTFREAATGWLTRAVPGRLGLTRLPDAESFERRRALLVIGAIALAAVAACGSPAWGSKFGGTIAMVPGFVLLLFLLAGWRITWRKVLVVALSGVVVVAGFALVNYLQPADHRSHFGTFVASIFDGTWTTTVHRKIQTNLASVNNDWFSHYVPWLLLWCLLAIVAPRLIGSRSLTQVYASEPYIRAALWLALITVGIGWFVDDSGILVPKMALFLAVPLAVVSAARALTPPTGAPAPPSVSGAPVPSGLEDQSSGADEAGLLA
jgi:hypothetical protein